MDYTESGYTQLLSYTGGLDLSTADFSFDTDYGGVSSATIGGFSSNVLSNPTLDSRSTDTLTEGTIPAAWEVGRHAFIYAGVDGYNDGTGFYLGWDETLETYVFSIGNSSGDSLTWDGTTLSLTGTLTLNSGSVGGWTVTSGYIYSLQSGTPTSSPSDGVVLASGNEALLVYENTEKRVEVGFLSSGVYGIKGYDNDGSTVLFELSDTQRFLSGWTLSSSTLANGTDIILDATNKAISINDATFGNTGIQIQYNSGTPRMHIGSTTKYMQYDGTDLNVVSGVVDGDTTLNGSTATNVQTRAEDDYSEYDFVYKGAAIDSDTALTSPFITISGGGSVTRNVLTSAINSGGSTFNLERMRSAIFGRHYTGGFNTTFNWGVIDITFSFTFDIDQSTNQDAFLGLYRDGANPPSGANATDTARHIGLYITDSTVYFSNADGTTQTTTDVTSDFTFGEFNYVEIVWDSGTSATLYLNGSTTASATHTTNLPATTSNQEPTIAFQVETQENATKLITLKNNYVIAANIV